jgi:hypothetical protein
VDICPAALEIQNKKLKAKKKKEEAKTHLKAM